MPKLWVELYSKGVDIIKEIELKMRWNLKFSAINALLTKKRAETTLTSDSIDYKLTTNWGIIQKFHKSFHKLHWSQQKPFR